MVTVPGPYGYEANMALPVRQTTAHHLKCHLRSWNPILLVFRISYSPVMNKKEKPQRSTEIYLSIASINYYIKQNVQFADHEMSAVGTQRVVYGQCLRYQCPNTACVFNLASSMSMEVFCSSLVA